MAEKTHTSQNFENNLHKVRQNLNTMTENVIKMIQLTTAGLLEQDKEKCQEVLSLEDEVNKHEIEIDHQCIDILAKWQPLAYDLRFICQVFKIVTDIERIGDKMSSTAELLIQDLVSEELLDEQFKKSLCQLSCDTLLMLREGVASMLEKDSIRARKTIEYDEKVNKNYHEIREDLFQKRLTSKVQIEDINVLHMVFKNYEKIGDHCANIAEHVMYVLEGVDLRHSST